MSIQNQKRASRNRLGLKLAIALSMLQGITAAVSSAAEPALSSRSLVIAVDTDAPPQVKAAAEAIRAAVNQQPLLKLMAGEHPVSIVDSEKLLSGKYEQRAFNHLIVVGLPQSKLVSTVWQHEATVDGDSISVFGFGHFKGDLGYIESDRNPFMHSTEVAKAPFETELVTITGTTAEGVALAANAFVNRGIVNGVIARDNGWSRTSPSLLDLPPIAPDVQLPDVPAELGKAPVIAVTQASGDEYRNVLADAGVEPKTIWRFKYYPKGAWDAPDAAAAVAEYNAGLHRRAFADTLWVGVFDTAAAAEAAASKIAASAGLSKDKNGAWTGEGKPDAGAPVELWVKGSSVCMSDLRR